jgi:hypothetical protein
MMDGVLTSFPRDQFYYPQLFQFLDERTILIQEEDNLNQVIVELDTRTSIYLKVSADSYECIRSTNVKL